MSEWFSGWMSRRPALPVLFLLLMACGGGGAVDSRRTVTEATGPAFVRLELQPISVVVVVGGTAQLTAVPVDAAGRALTGLPAATYRSDASGTATVDAAGLVRGVTPGEAVVTASLTADGVTRTASAAVTVTAEAPAPRTVRTPGVAFDPASLTIAAGDTVTWQFSGAIHNVTFTGAAPPGGSIGDQAVGTDVKRVFPSAGTFAYECTRHAGMTGEVIVQSGTPVFTSVAITPDSASILEGDTIRLIATARDQHGSVMAGLGPAVFTTSDASVASVNGGGVVTGVVEGTATIRASVTQTGVTHTAAATVTVAARAANTTTVTTPNLRFSPQSVTVPVGGTVTWQFSESVHNVKFNGAAPAGGDVPDQNPGTSASRTFATAGTYTYACTRHNGMVGEVVVQADGGPARFSGVTVSPVQWAMREGATKPIQATPVDQSGLPMSGLPQAVYTSSDPAIVRVGAGGVLHAAGQGTATITATVTSNGVTHTASTGVTVVPATAVIVTIGTGGYAPDRVEIPPGGFVIWEVSGSAHNMTFDVAPAGGDIPQTDPGNAVARVFATAGDYDYECTLHGEKGRVRVR